MMEWISILELPQKEQEVIVYFRNDVGWHVSTCYWDGEDFISDPDGRQHVWTYKTPITHWMPLPEPPKQ